MLKTVVFTLLLSSCALAQPAGGVCNVSNAQVNNYVLTAVGTGKNCQWKPAGGTPTFASCHAYTYTSGTLTVDFSTYNCAIVTASGANPTLAFTSPGDAIPLTLGLCNDASSRTWTLPGTAKQVGTPVIASTCVYNNGGSFDGTNYQFPGSNETPSIVRFSSERSAPSTPAASTGVMWPDSTSHNLEYMANNSSIVYKMMSPNDTYRSCDIPIGDTSGSAITNAQLGPQSRICFIPAASTIIEVDVNADGGTPNIILGRNRAGSISNILSTALATAASGGIACSNTGGTTGLNGATTCSGTLQNTSLSAGDYLEAVSGTAGGTAKFFVAHVIYTVN